MKKVLLTASALSLLAGAAAAEVTVGGDARFGLTYDFNASDYDVDQRYRVFFNASTETDGGLTLGARAMLDTRYNGSIGGADGVSALGGQSWLPVITASGNGFSFALGDSNGAVVDKVGLWAGGLGFDGTVGRPAIVAGFDTDGNANDQTLQLGYAFGDFSFAVSTGLGAGNPGTFEYAAAYSANGISVAIGGNDASQYAVSGSYAAGDFKVGAIYRSNPNMYRVYGTYSFGATTVGANYTDTGASAWGIGVSHSLGGGVTAHGAVGQQAAGGNTVLQVGMTMSF